MAVFTFTNAAYINQPATTGNRVVTLLNRADYTLTLADFTTQTVPAYSDPENDPLAAVRIDTLPATGFLKYNNVVVALGMILTSAEISSGKLKFFAPNQDALISSVFTFSVKDSGSGQFTS
ncbi:MAG: hypothetical protein ACRC0V_07230 [Fusobacteriaceae bacterium]|uniref:hypothetical protein n=1 Tax=Romboutsia sp. TaxID=1965302 RepID=UPI003F29FFAE